MFTLPDDPYKAIGVPSNAQVPEIRSAYRKLVLKCHPDKVTDPAQKAIKNEEFQKVQKAYELLCDDNERQIYDDMVQANDLEKGNAETRRQRDRESTPSRTPNRPYESEYGRSPHYTVRVNPEPVYKPRGTEPRDPPSFTKSATWASSGSNSPYPGARTPTHSYEEMNNYGSFEDLPPRESRDSRDSRRPRESREPPREPSSYREKGPRHEDERRSKRSKAEKEEELFERERAQEKAKRKEREKAEKRETERLELERRERRDKEKRRADKARDTDRKRDADDKRSRHKAPYIEEDGEPVSFAPKSEKKSKSSSRSKEVPVQIREEREPRSEREIKQRGHLDFAAQYLETSRSKVAPGLQRRQTYHANVRSTSPLPPPPAVATPPPAAAGMAPPPPMPSMAQKIYEEEEEDEPPRRSSAPRRRMSHDTPRAKEKTSSSHKKSSSARDPEYVTEPSRPVAPPLKKSTTMPTGGLHQAVPIVANSPPKLGRSKTDFVRPNPGAMPRTATWTPGGDADRDRGRSRPQAFYSDDESEEDARPRRSHRTRSPDEMQGTYRYTVENGRTKAAPRAASYREEDPRGGKPSYYMPESNSSRPLEHRPAMHSYDSYSSQHFPRVKTSRPYNDHDVVYSDIQYNPRGTVY